MAFHPTPQSTTRPSQSSLPLDDFDSAPASTPARPTKTFRPSMPNVELPFKFDFSDIKLPSSMLGLIGGAAAIGLIFPSLNFPVVSGVGRSVIDFTYSAYGNHIGEIKIRGANGDPMTMPVPTGQTFGDDAGYPAFHGDIPLSVGIFEIGVVSKQLKDAVVFSFVLFSLSVFFENRQSQNKQKDRNLSRALQALALFALVWSMMSASEILNLDPRDQTRFDDVPFIGNKLPTDRVD